MSRFRLVVCAVFFPALLVGWPGIGYAQAGDAEAVIRDLMAVWESGDASQLSALFHDDAVYVDKPNARELEGLDEIEGYVEHVHSWAADVDIEITEIRGGESFAVAEWVMKGVQDRPIDGMVPVATHRPFAFHGLTMVVVMDGKAVRAVDYIQVVPLMLQLGARIELPGGVVLGGGPNG